MSISHDRVMLVTGGTGSVGSAVVREALAHGWRVVLHGRSEGRVSDAAEKLDASDSQLRTIAVDAFAAHGAETIVSNAAACFGRIDAVVDCLSGGPAGFRITGPFAQTEPDGYAGLLEASVVHLQKLSHAALPWLKKQGGTIIAFASDAGKFAAPNQTMIGTSRAALMAFIRQLSVEVARDGVRAHCMSPSYIEDSTSLIATEKRVPGRLDKARKKAGLGLPTPDDIAPLVLFLCSDGATKITGQIISINGGMNA